MQQRPFRQIDVFSHHPGFGNPVAVVLDAQGLSDADMRRFAALDQLVGNHLSDAAHGSGPCGRGRLPAAHLSPRGELPLPATPLGTCRAWLQQGHAARARPGGARVCAGPGANRTPGRHLAFAAPPLQRSKPSPALVPLVASALGLRPTKSSGAIAGQRPRVAGPAAGQR